jgi:hypothetical protein
VSSPDSQASDTEPPPLAGTWTLRCAACRRTVSLDLAAVAVFTRHRWPTCCEQAMSLFVREERVAGGPVDVL